jgi:hypothetical protein
MFRSLPLHQAFRYLVSPEEWSWFGPMAGPRVYHIGLDGWPLFELHQIRDFQSLWPKLAEEALVKLQEGEWTAEGICRAVSPQRVPIDPLLWDYLRFVGRLEEAEGGGFHFIALTVSQAGPIPVEFSYRQKSSLRRQLTDWIRLQATLPGPPLLRLEQLAAARAAFPGCNITPNMFRDRRREAGLPREAVQQGRPKAKGSDN